MRRFLIASRKVFADAMVRVCESAGVRGAARRGSAGRAASVRETVVAVRRLLTNDILTTGSYSMAARAYKMPR